MTNTPDEIITEASEDMDSILILTDEDGNDVPFEIMGQIQYQGDTYLVLLEAETESDEVVILKAEGLTDETEDEEISLVSVSDETVLNAVFELFKENYSDLYDFTD